jgi:hypothetical protein
MFFTDTLVGVATSMKGEAGYFDFALGFFLTGEGE